MTAAAMSEILTTWGPPGLLLITAVYMLVRGRVSFEYPYQGPDVKRTNREVGRPCPVTPPAQAPPKPGSAARS